ncbi:M20/M25/M40 family metallo-hydrolase [Spirosoma sp. KCTC 42546]|uniref:M20 family metallo-hydrolase n=1 Tax=Spirosoma sp. KCTC 42546 TaxID=2520506 RepID=UPI001158CF39|nr:M20 family metallo-hydrolase [Spirosoma sp. KCTC 42546]QDK78221.1 M20/M25/M40 family metallo-hydrolase [Spirosoma sp. KCTC 42546]
MSQLDEQSTQIALTTDAFALLKRLISIPSFSRQEEQTATQIESFFQEKQIPFKRLKNNVWAQNKHFDSSKPTLLLNSHHDTVKPNPSWTLDPFEPLEHDDKLYGLGSNDAGGCLVSLLATFAYFYDRPNMAYNMVMAATAEEEISGRDGLELLLPELPPLSFAIVGEPTEMQLAIAEKGLLVLDCTAHGVSGHAARDEGDNAIYKAIRDINWLTTYQFPKVSPTLGPIKLSVTIINAGTQHNVVPDTCTFTIDVRVTEQYTLEEVIDTIQANINATVKPRSIRLKPSSIPINHPIVQAGLALGRYTYGSPTTSDQAVLNCPSLKCGPGHSARSHSADEFIYSKEIAEGITGYIQMLEQII